MNIIQYIYVCVSLRKTDSEATRQWQRGNKTLINFWTNKHYLCLLRNSAAWAVFHPWSLTANCKLRKINHRRNIKLHPLDTHTHSYLAELNFNFMDEFFESFPQKKSCKMTRCEYQLAERHIVESVYCRNSLFQPPAVNTNMIKKNNKKIKKSLFNNTVSYCARPQRTNQSQKDNFSIK